jgi:hypothetical protein
MHCNERRNALKVSIEGLVYSGETICPALRAHPVQIGPGSALSTTVSPRVRILILIRVMLFIDIVRSPTPRYAALQLCLSFRGFPTSAILLTMLAKSRLLVDGTSAREDGEGRVTSSVGDSALDCSFPASSSVDVVRMCGTVIFGHNLLAHRLWYNSVCPECHRCIKGPFVRALGIAFHPECFTCTVQIDYCVSSHFRHSQRLLQDCGDLLTSTFFPMDGSDGGQQALCERDYFRRRNLICAMCGQALRRRYVIACSALWNYHWTRSSLILFADKRYHPEHFACAAGSCSTPLWEQDYYEHENEYYCQFHYSTRFATKCAGCDSAILGSRRPCVEIKRRTRHECWHQDCHMIYEVQ